MLATGAVRVETITVPGFAISYNVPFLENPAFTIHVSINHVLVPKTSNVLLPEVPFVLTARTFIGIL